VTSGPLLLRHYVLGAIQAARGDHGEAAATFGNAISTLRAGDDLSPVGARRCCAYALYCGTVSVLILFYLITRMHFEKGE
jgi:hypothetical protein